MMSYVTVAADRMITRVKQAEDLAVGTVSTVTSIVGGFVPTLPKLPLVDRLPAPETVVNTGFGIAQGLLEKQKQAALNLVQVLGLITDKIIPSKPVKIAATNKA